MSGPLSAVRVIDLTDLRGALCGRILADLGADVVKVEAPGADPELLSSTSYRYRNANKRGAVLDPTARKDRARLDVFLAQADVLVENLGPTERQRAGLIPHELGESHPQLVHVALTDLGLSGRLSEWRLEALPAMAASGTLHASGFPDLPPCWLPGHLAHDCASVYGALGVVACLMDRRRNGGGQLVEVSTQEAALAGTTPWSIALRDYLGINPLLPSKGTRNADGSYWVLPTADGWVRTVIGNKKQWDGFVALLGSPEVLDGPQWEESAFRIANADVVRLVAEELLTDRTRAQLFDQARDFGTTLGVIHTPSEFVAHPQTRSRAFFTATGFPGLGDAPFATSALRLTATPTSLRRPAPAPGQDDTIDDATGLAGRWSTPVPPTPPKTPDAPSSPVQRLLLDGVRVVEFGMAAVVPELCLVLSELGADVIKIESLAHPDVLRMSGAGLINRSFAFNVECRGRRSVALDLSTEEGRELALALCAQADVVAENFRGGVLDGLGLGYEQVQAVNPTVVYAASQGYGRGGPFAEMPAYGPLNFGFSGLHHLWNHPEAPYPCGTALNHPDHIAGKLLAVGVLAALAHRDETGEGQLVELAQTEAAAFLLGEVYLEAALTGCEPGPQGNRSDLAVPHGVYPSAGEDRWVAVVVPDDAAWSRLCSALGWELSPDTATLGHRLAERETIDARLASWTGGQSAEAAAALLQAHGVSAMPVMGPEDHHGDLHLAERGFIVHLEHPEVGPERHAGNPLRLSRLAQRTAESAPCLGADTEEVLTSVVGLSPERVAELANRGVCR